VQVRTRRDVQFHTEHLSPFGPRLSLCARSPRIWQPRCVRSCDRRITLDLWLGLVRGQVVMTV
jgi:hypothetical protein